MEAITQRRVNASTAARPATSAPSSVFDIGRQAKAANTPTRAPRTVVDVTKLQIRKGVPMPNAARGTQGHKYQELLTRMQPGDSIIVTPQVAKAIVAAATKLKIKAAYRSLGDGTAGVWKL